MELYEKIIIASAMGLYLCVLIYRNRDYFINTKRHKTESTKDSKNNPHRDNG